MSQVEFELYCDGGVVNANPSPIGGVWAFCVVARADGKEWIHRTGCGFVEPAAYGTDTVSNNVTELLAMAHGLMALPDTWHGRIYCDSLITIRRAQGAPGWNGIHPEVREWVETRLHRLRRNGRLEFILLAGHPTREDLARGYKIKQNKSKTQWPVSKYNVECDEMCKREARRVMAERNAATTSTQEPPKATTRRRSRKIGQLPAMEPITRQEATQAMQEANEIIRQEQAGAPPEKIQEALLHGPDKVFGEANAALAGERDYHRR